jgi:hypothetical protein
MKSSIKIIKHKRNDNTNHSRIGQAEKTAERTTRETVSIVKSWIDDLKKKRRAQGRMVFPPVRLAGVGHGPSGR